jgi:4-hydroxy 2-oxovalerate aldolase
VKILDCTMRDGGYHNDWDFSSVFAQKYFDLLSCLGIEYAEVGFRFLKNEGFYGPFAFSSEEFLSQFVIPENLQIGVMVNAAEFDMETYIDQLDSLFQESHLSKLSFVRVAANFSELKVALAICRELNSRFGFKVFLNIMQMSFLDEKQIDQILQEDLTFIEALYFADSTGSMNPTEIMSFFKYVKEHTRVNLGIHAHDNLGMAFANSLLALNEGAIWCDGTLMGMGRGAGNTKTEMLWLQESSATVGTTQWVKLAEFLGEDMNSIRQINPWGESLEFALGALFGAHPTFIQSLKDNTLLNLEEKFIALKKLTGADNRRFSNTNLKKALSFSFTSESRDNPLLLKAFGSMNVLLVTNSDLVKKHIDAIIDFIKRSNVVVVSINNPRFLPLDLVDFIVTCNGIRLEEIITNMDNIKCPVVIPFQYLLSDEYLSLEEKQFVDFPISINPDASKDLVSTKSIPKSLSALYALNLLISCKPRRMFLAGFDGKGLNQIQLNDFATSASQLVKEAQEVEIVSILETFLMVPVKSVYGQVQVD